MMDNNCWHTVTATSGASTGDFVIYYDGDTGDTFYVKEPVEVMSDQFHDLANKFFKDSEYEYKYCKSLVDRWEREEILARLMV